MCGRIGQGAAATILTLVLGGCAVHAPDGAAARTPPDRTERLAAACNGCHGPGGRGSGAIPALAGGDPALLRQRMEAWRRTPVAEGTDHLMVRFVRGLKTGDLDALARYYGALEPRPPGPGGTSP